MWTPELNARFRLLGELAGLHRRVTPRMLRDTRVLLLVREWVDPETIQQWLGYSDRTSMLHHLRAFRQDWGAAEGRIEGG